MSTTEERPAPSEITANSGDEIKEAEHKNESHTEQEAQEPSPKPVEQKRGGVVALVALLVLIGAILVYNYLQPEGTHTPIASLVSPDANAEDMSGEGNPEGGSEGEAETNYFALQINPEARFSSETGWGDFELINPPTNAFPITFEIVLDDSGECIYKSGSVMPNQQIKGITLDAALPPGSYEATVKVTIYNQNTHLKEGETQAKIKLDVV